MSMECLFLSLLINFGLKAFLLDIIVDRTVWFLGSFA